MLEPIFKWAPIVVPAPKSAEVTRGTFVIQDDNKNIIWGNEDFEWSWVEILEWLTYNWESLHTVEDSINPDNDLRFALQGAYPPVGFAMWWDGADTGYFKVGDRTLEVSSKDWELFLIRLGNAIADRVQLTFDARSKIVLADWKMIFFYWKQNEQMPVEVK